MSITQPIPSKEGFAVHGLSTSDPIGEQWPITRVTLLLAAIILVFFHAILFQNRTMLCSAVSHPSIMDYGAYFGNPSKQLRPAARCGDACATALFTEPWMVMTSCIYKVERCVPLWNQYSGCGAPYLANMQSAVLDPLNFGFSLFPSSWSVDLHALTKLLITGMLAFIAIRLYTPPGAAVVGAVAYMLTGYQLLFLGLPQTNPSMVLPLLVLGTELIIRRPCIPNAAICIAGVALTLIGGMPEVAFCQFLLSGLYALFRLSMVSPYHLRWKTLGWVAACYLGGALVAAPQLFPFLEFMRYSNNCHDTNAGACSVVGLMTYRDWSEPILSHLTPGAFPDASYPTGFWGTVVAFLAFFGMFFGVSRRQGDMAEDRFRLTRFLSWFYGSMAGLLILKRVGCPIINWVGSLPLFTLVNFLAYSEPVIGFCVAVLAALGATAVLRRELRPKLLAASLGTLLLLWAALLLEYHRVQDGHLQSQHHFLRAQYIELALLGLTCVTLALVQRFSGIVRWAPLILICLICADVYGGFFSRAYSAKNLPLREIDPYKGAPYISYLQQKSSANYRVFGLGGPLFPNWSTAFRIRDLRTLDGLFPSGYLPFIRSQFPNEAFDTIGKPEIYSCFSGNESGVVRSACDPIVRAQALHRLLALTSTKYLITSFKLPNDSATIHPVQQLASPTTKGECFLRERTISGINALAITMHPEANGQLNEVRYFTGVPPSAPIFAFDIVWNPILGRENSRASVECSFAVEQAGKQTLVFNNLCSPKTKEASSKPEAHTVDLSRFRGKGVLLCFRARSAPAGIGPSAWIAWHHMRWQSSNGACSQVNSPSQEKLVYKKEVAILEIPRVLSRASVFKSMRLAHNDLDALNILRSEDFDPFRQVVLNEHDLNAEQLSHLSSLDLSGTQQAMPAFIETSTSNTIVVHCPQTKGPSLLLLTDTFYPGWRAFVDGKELPILKANYCFRAVMLPENTKYLTFKYDPISWKLGCSASFLSLLVLIIMGIAERKVSNNCATTTSYLSNVERNSILTRLGFD
jgi:hypothetical protein